MNAIFPTEVPALTKAEQRRLERLAGITGRSPRATLRGVLRDGFEVVEENVRETLQGEAECDAGQVVPHEQVMAEARAIIGRHSSARGRKTG